MTAQVRSSLRVPHLRLQRCAGRNSLPAWLLILGCLLPSESDVQRRTAACYRLRNTCGDLREEMRYEVPGINIFWQLDSDNDRREEMPGS